MSSDYRAMARAYPLAAGTTPVASGFNIAQWRQLHGASCTRCSPTPDPACEGQRIIDVLERGWRMQWTGTPPKAAKRGAPRATPHLWKATQALAAQAKIFEITEVSTAARCFAVSKKRFSDAAADATPWLEDPACAIPVFQPGKKLRMVFDYRRSLANKVSLRWPLQLPPLAATARICRENHWLVSADCKAGYTQIPYAQCDWNIASSTAARLAFTVADASGKQRWYAPKFLMFGSNSAGSMFCTVSALASSILEHVLVARGHDPACHLVWVDDWLLSAPTKDAAERKLEDFLDVCQRLGIVINGDKVVHATQLMHWLGLDIDIQRRRFLLAPQRIAQVRTEASRLLRLKLHCPVADMRRFAGLACWCAMCVPGSRAFTATLCATGQQRRNVAVLSKMCCEDLEFWQREGTWQGYREGLPMLRPGHHSFCAFVSDAGGTAAGAHTAKACAWRAFSPLEQSWSSTARELMGIELGLTRLCASARDSIIVIGCDNVAAVIAANAGRVGRAHSAAIPVVRRIGRWAAARNVHLVGVWLPRNFNKLSDALAACSSQAQASDVFARALHAHSSAQAAASATIRPPRC
jgi:hypothetical protein